MSNDTNCSEEALVAAKTRTRHWVQVDDQGCLALPPDILEEFELKEGDLLDIEVLPHGGFSLSESVQSAVHPGESRGPGSGG